jgi:hypothetical protein
VPRAKAWDRHATLLFNRPNSDEPASENSDQLLRPRPAFFSGETHAAGHKGFSSIRSIAELEGGLPAEGILEGVVNQNALAAMERVMIFSNRATHYAPEPSESADALPLAEPMRMPESQPSAGDQRDFHSVETGSASNASRGLYLRAFSFVSCFRLLHSRCHFAFVFLNFILYVNFYLILQDTLLFHLQSSILMPFYIR